MEMKKQVLSFSEFINEAYNIIQEAKTFEDAKQKLSDLVDGTGKRALASMESLLKQNSNSGILEFVGSEFNELINKYDGDGRKIDSILVDLTWINYKKLIQGNAFVSKAPEISKLSEGYKLDIKDGKVKLVDLLGTVNAENITRKAQTDPFTKDKKGRIALRPIKEGDRKGIYPGSGADKQFILTDIGANGFEFSFQNSEEGVEFMESPKNNITLDVWTAKSRKEIKKGESNILYCTLVTYIIKDIIPGGGDAIKIEDIDKVVTIVKGGDEELDVNIADNGTLFEKAKAILKEEGKQHINNAVLNQFSTVSSIEVVGGASKEGNPDFNKKLCADRSKAVAEYLKTVCKEAEIKVSSEANIQPEESTDDLKTWRKVTLKVKGTKRSLKKDGEVVDYVARVKNIKADKAVLAQVCFEFTIELD